MSLILTRDLLKANKGRKINAFNDSKLGKISMKSRSKDSTSRRTKVETINIKKSRTEKERNKNKRGNSLKSTGVSWKARTNNRSKNRNKSLR